MKTSNQQSGFALLMLMVILLGATTYALSSLLSTSVKQKNEQARLETLQVLQEAKEALVSYALNYSLLNDLEKMGRLPCPDRSSAGTEGNQDPNCGVTQVNTLGYYPFKSLGKGKIEDASGECLWYVVSGDYKETPSANLLNWDSVGYLNLVDENANLKHGGSENDFPVAFIISPGKTINQTRTTDAALPECSSNFTLANYLEGGPNIDYAVDLPLTVDTLWEILSASEASQVDDTNYNDNVIAIYKHELWDRIIKLGDLSFDNSDINPGPAPGNTDPINSNIESFTKSMAECLASYGNANAGRLLPYPVPIDIDPTDLDPDEYSSNTNYNDDNSIRYGRFPQVIDVAGSPTLTNNFVLDTSAAQSYCEAAGVTAYDELFWENWKDHFFYIVSADFDPASATPANATKCAAAGSCFTIDSKANKIAALVIFAGPAEPGITRTWWWDDATSTVTTDDKSSQLNYLEGDNQVVYTGLVAQDYDLSTSPNDYSYCVEYDNTLFTLSAVKCADL